MAESPAARPTSWLIAAWPGMGNVAVIAAGYLIQSLKLRPVDQLTLPAHFDIQAVEVTKGVIAAPHLPHSYFFRPAEPLPGGQDLTVFVGESQPVAGSYAFAQALLDRAKQYGPKRIITFASMASQMHPSQPAQVHGAATQGDLLDELRRLEVSLMEEGQIGGMNGVLLGAAAERGLAGLCLLGEIPYFAAGVANPKAAKAVLDAFSLLSGIEMDLEEIGRHAEAVDQALTDMLEKLQAQAREQREGENEGEDEAGAAPEEPPAAGEHLSEGQSDSPLDEAARTRIERMFKVAARDRTKAVGLKQELDRLGVFSRFENRFLDLFKRAE